MDINSEIRTRIIAAAEQLFVDAGSDRFPTVDEVRRAAKADMNTTSTVMKQWRREQVAAPATVAVSVPDRVKEAALAATAQLWGDAQELANESLDVAKKAWEAERVEADTMRTELADAYELQAGELAAVQHQLTEVQATAQVAEQKQAEQAELLSSITVRLTDVEGKEKAAQARLVELRDELSQEKTDAAEAAKQHRTDIDAIRKQSESEAVAHRKALSDIQQKLTDATNALELLKVRSDADIQAAKQAEAVATGKADKLATDLQNATNIASDAREMAAGLQGELKATLAQNRELTARIEVPKKERKMVE
jgi:chromosome segregation ATPase